jgi:sugar phosphate isomerase/epimerase
MRVVLQAELIAYHALNFADAEGPARASIRERALLEESALSRLLQRAHTLGIVIALENLAPVHVSPPRLAHDPLLVRDLVRRLRSPAAGMLLDLGHLHITADASHSDLAGVAAAVAPDVVLFHVHDNDLHLPPGRGSLPWGRVAGVLREHPVPLLLEVEPSQRPLLPELTAATLRALAAEPQRAAA